MYTSHEDCLQDELAHRERVLEKLAPIVFAFLRSLVAMNPNKAPTFYSQELFAYAKMEAPEIAPESVTRCLRGLRQRKLLYYTCVCRAESEYRLWGITIGVEL